MGLMGFCGMQVAAVQRLITKTENDNENARESRRWKRRKIFSKYRRDFRDTCKHFLLFRNHVVEVLGVGGEVLVEILKRVGDATVDAQQDDVEVEHRKAQDEKVGERERTLVDVGLVAARLLAPATHVETKRDADEQIENPQAVVGTYQAEKHDKIGENGQTVGS